MSPDAISSPTDNTGPSVRGEASDATVEPGARPRGAAGVVGPKSATARIQPYDFRNPAYLSEFEFRRLRSLHEDFARHLGARLSLYLRMELGLTLSALTTAPYSKFTDSLPDPAHVSLFKLDPLVGVGVVNVNPRLALTIADRLLGGRGQCSKASRYLTEIETALLEDVIQMLLEEWSNQWRPERELRPLLIGHENTGRYLQTSPRGAIMLVIALECSFGECCEPVQVALPYYTIEPVLRKVQMRGRKEAAAAAPARRPEWQRVHEGITVPLCAEWDAFEVPIREIASLRVGDVLELPASICAETRVRLSGSPKFIGTAGLDGGRVAVQLTRKVGFENSSHAKPVGRKDP